MLRAFFIALSRSTSIRAFAERSPMGKKMSHRFVAGETVDDLIRAVEAVNKLGIRVTVDNLGENVTSRDEALHSKALYHQLLDEIEKRKLDANVSLKLTHMGLDVDEKLARDIRNTPSGAGLWYKHGLSHPHSYRQGDPLKESDAQSIFHRPVGK